MNGRGDHPDSGVQKKPDRVSRNLIAEIAQRDENNRQERHRGDGNQEGSNDPPEGSHRLTPAARSSHSRNERLCLAAV